MEKITKEELLAKLGGKALSDDELENVTGGGAECWEWIHSKFFECQDTSSDLTPCYQARCADLASCGLHDMVNCGF